MAIMAKTMRDYLTPTIRKDLVPCEGEEKERKEVKGTVTEHLASDKVKDKEIDMELNL